jgi:hypothetical protein
MRHSKTPQVFGVLLLHDQVQRPLLDLVQFLWTVIPSLLLLTWQFPAAGPLSVLCCHAAKLLDPDKFQYQEKQLYQF